MLPTIINKTRKVPNLHFPAVPVSLDYMRDTSLTVFVKSGENNTFLGV